MTEKKEREFDQMYLSLRRIAQGFMTPEEIRRDAVSGRLGMSWDHQIETAYDSIQREAKNGLSRIRPPKTIKYLTPPSGPPIGWGKNKDW